MKAAQVWHGMCAGENSRRIVFVWRLAGVYAVFVARIRVKL